MNDDGSSSLLENLKHEWSLLWHSITGEDEVDEKVRSEVSEYFATLNFEQLRQIGKVLSEERKIVNQKLEHLQKEIEILNAKAEGLRLVGGEAAETETRIDLLHEQGQRFTDKLEKIDEKLKLIRQRELQIDEEAAEA